MSSGLKNCLLILLSIQMSALQVQASARWQVDNLATLPQVEKKVRWEVRVGKLERDQLRTAYLDVDQVFGLNSQNGGANPEIYSKMIESLSLFAESKGKINVKLTYMVNQNRSTPIQHTEVQSFDAIPGQPLRFRINQFYGNQGIWGLRLSPEKTVDEAEREGLTLRPELYITKLTLELGETAAIAPNPTPVPPGRPDRPDRPDRERRCEGLTELTEKWKEANKLLNACQGNLKAAQEQLLQCSRPGNSEPTMTIQAFSQFHCSASSEVTKGLVSLFVPNSAAKAKELEAICKGDVLKNSASPLTSSIRSVQIVKYETDGKVKTECRNLLLNYQNFAQACMSIPNGSEEIFVKPKKVQNKYYDNSACSGSAMGTLEISNLSEVAQKCSTLNYGLYAGNQYNDYKGKYVRAISVNGVCLARYTSDDDELKKDCVTTSTDEYLK